MPCSAIGSQGRPHYCTNGSLYESSIDVIQTLDFLLSVMVFLATLQVAAIFVEYRVLFICRAVVSRISLLFYFYYIIYFENYCAAQMYAQTMLKYW